MISVTELRGSNLTITVNDVQYVRNPSDYVNLDDDSSPLIKHEEQGKSIFFLNFILINSRT